jgi:hypothetical protein
MVKAWQPAALAIPCSLPAKEKLPHDRTFLLLSMVLR